MPTWKGTATSTSKQTRLQDNSLQSANQLASHTGHEDTAHRVASRRRRDFRWQSAAAHAVCEPSPVQRTTSAVDMRAAQRPHLRGEGGRCPLEVGPGIWPLRGRGRGGAQMLTACSGCGAHRCTMMLGRHGLPGRHHSGAGACFPMALARTQDVDPRRYASTTVDLRSELCKDGHRHMYRQEQHRSQARNPCVGLSACVGPTRVPHPRRARDAGYAGL